VAFNLDAQWHISAVAGIVLTQSCCAMGFVMPDVFSKMNFQTTGSDLNFDQYIPDVVTISLRQNDGLVDSIDFCSAYVDCIGELKIHCPDATIFCMSSPMADNYLNNALDHYLSEIVNYMNGEGDSKVFKFTFS
jgi:hypothetical protein